MKTILFISSTDLSLPSANNNRLLATARGLVENGINVVWVLFTPNPPNRIIHDTRYVGINFISLVPRNSGGLLARYSNALRRLFAFRKLPGLVTILKEKYSVSAGYVIGDDFIENHSVLQTLHKFNIPVFHESGELPGVHVRKISRKWLRFQLYLRFIVPKMDHFFVISSSLQEYFSTYLSPKGVSSPVSIMPVIVEPDRFIHSRFEDTNHNEAARRYRDIVYAGTMYGDKDGVNILILAFGMIQADFPDVRLILVGDNTKKNCMHQIINSIESIESLDARNRIVFTGMVDRDKVTDYYNNSYCLVLARPANIQAKYGFPTKLGEYLACGKPVVITKVGDIPLYFKDGVNAYLAEPSNIKSFADKLRKCLDDPVLAKQIGQEGEKLVHTIFNYKECVQVIVDAL